MNTMHNPKKTVAAIQLASGSNVSANLLKAGQLVEEAVESGAGLVVLPENFAFMGKQDQDLLELREHHADLRLSLARYTAHIPIQFARLARPGRAYYGHSE